MIPITARTDRYSVVVLFCLVSHVISRNYLFLLLFKPTYFDQTNRKLIEKWNLFLLVLLLLLLLYNIHTKRYITCKYIMVS